MVRLYARKKQLKLLMALMLVFMVAAPLLGPVIDADAFRQMNAAGRRFFYVATPMIFGFLFFFYLTVYRRTERKIRKHK